MIYMIYVTHVKKLLDKHVLLLYVNELYKEVVNKE